jgi:hypothetical protein
VTVLPASFPLTALTVRRPVVAPTETDYLAADRASERARYGPLGVWLLVVLRGLWAALRVLAAWLWQWVLPNVWAGLRVLTVWMWRQARQSPQRAAAVLLALLLLSLSVWLFQTQPWRKWSWPAVMQTSVSQQAPTPVPAAVVPTATPPMPACGRVKVTAQRVNLRVAPGLGKRAEVLRKLDEGEILWKLCDEVQAADGHTWQRVLGETDVLPGWVAVEYLRVVK